MRPVPIDKEMPVWRVGVHAHCSGAQWAVGIGEELANDRPHRFHFLRPDFTVERRPVTTGNRIGRETIIASGLKDGETLITSGQEHVTPGKRIKLHSENSRSLATTRTGAIPDSARTDR